MANHNQILHNGKHNESMDCIFNFIIWLVVTGCHEFGIFPYSYWVYVIIPIDFHIFQRGGPTTNQIVYSTSLWMTVKFRGWLVEDTADVFCNFDVGIL